MTFAVIWLIISVLIVNTMCAVGAKEVRIVKSKRVKMLTMNYLKNSYLTILNPKNNLV